MMADAIPATTASVTTSPQRPGLKARRSILTLFAAFSVSLLLPLDCYAATASLVIVKKKDRKLIVMSGSKKLAEFTIALGSNPVGHKRQQGDGRTPEGTYSLTSKNSGSKYYKSIRISYPNSKDRAQAAKRGVSPGGDIYIHGSPNGLSKIPGGLMKMVDWTEGCIAISNSEMDTLWKLVRTGTKIRIDP